MGTWPKLLASSTWLTAAQVNAWFRPCILRAVAFAPCRLALGRLLQLFALNQSPTFLESYTTIGADSNTAYSSLQKTTTAPFYILEHVVGLFYPPQPCIPSVHLSAAFFIAVYTDTCFARSFEYDIPIPQALSFTPDFAPHTPRLTRLYSYPICHRLCQSWLSH